MPLLIHVAAHPDQLVSGLCDLLAEPPADPFASELVAVPTRGIERWLTQAIASGLAERRIADGICANVELPSPRELVHRVLAQVPALAEADTAWEGPILTSHLLATIDSNLHLPWMRLLARHLDTPEDPGANRLTAAAKLARLYRSYARRRPEMIRAWARGDDLDPDREPLHPDVAWQAKLWRELRSRVGVPSLPELLPDALAPLRDGEIPLDLPDRISVYGLTAADPVDLQVLSAVAATRPVHLFVLHPSPTLWTDADSHLAELSVLPPRSDDPTATLAAHPLLAAWAHDARELQVVLAAAGHRATTIVPDVPQPTSLLQQLQADLRANRAPIPFTLDPGDRSVQVHVCHGARRQTEVARDAILHALSADPTLEPRDVVVMTPDLATFAPLLEAAFPSSDTGPDGLPDLRLRIADRSPAATNPLVRFAATLCDVAASRLEATAVRELVTLPVVQQRFGFDADLAGKIHLLIDDAHIAWGWDVDDRLRWGAGEVSDRTWRRGLDRALAGVFYADSPVRTVSGLAPLDGVEGTDATPVGQLAQLMDRLVAARSILTTPRPLGGWAEALASAVRLLAAPRWGDEWQWTQLENLLSDTFPPNPDPGPDVGLAEVRRAIAAWADDRPSPLHFRTGDITVCTLAPMRSVPYRVVVLVGMDDERFPRRGAPDGDDLVASRERVGDHDRGSEDRQLLCDALGAAGDHLIVTYSGRDPLTGAPLPPAVPIAELVDTVQDMVGVDVLSRIVTHHPLQAFSATNFVPGALNLAGPWGFDQMQLAGAQAVTERQDDPRTEPVAWPDPDPQPVIRLDDLTSFLSHPARSFLRARLGFRIPEPGELSDDTLPVDLGGLERWAVRDRILKGLLAGHDPDQLIDWERAADAVPPGSLATDDLEDAVEVANSLAEAARSIGLDPTARHPLSGAVPVGETVVEGTVSADPDQAVAADITPSRIRAHYRLRGYTRLCFLSALDPERPWTVALLGSKDDGKGLVHITLGPIGSSADQRWEEATSRLSALVDLYREGLAQPLFLPCETAYAYQRTSTAERPTRYKLLKALQDPWGGRFGEANQPEWRMLFPHITSVDQVLDSGIGDLCVRVWGPVLSTVRERRP